MSNTNIYDVGSLAMCSNFYYIVYIVLSLYNLRTLEFWKVVCLLSSEVIGMCNSCGSDTCCFNYRVCSLITYRDDEIT